MLTDDLNPDRDSAGLRLVYGFGKGGSTSALLLFLK